MPQWKQYSGSWTLSQQMQARGSDEWPAVPGAPTSVTATAGNLSASVAFTAPANLGVPAVITQYTVTSSPGSFTGTGTSSPIVVSGLSEGTAYTFTVTATNATGTGPASAASNSVTPFVAGQLWAWGNNEYGTFGSTSPVGNSGKSSSPTQVGSLTTWVKALQTNGAGGNSFGINDGNLFGWGRNDNGNHAGVVGDNTLVNRSSPVQIGTSNWTDVTGGTFTGLAIQDGKLYGWGANLGGMTGLNDTSRRSSPIQVGSLNNWKQVSIGNGVGAVKTDGTLWTWGFNTAGQLGHNDTVERSSPVQVGALTNWKMISSGQQAMVAIKTDGTLWTWGTGNSGALGSGNVTNVSSPVQVGALTNWNLVSMGNYMCLAVKTDGTLWSWGKNNNGELGQNDRTYRSSPTQVGALTNWKQPSNARSFNTCGAIKTNGTLWMWGENYDGNLGTNDTINRSSPVQVGALTTWVYVAAGGANTFGIKTG